MADVNELRSLIEKQFANCIRGAKVAYDELTVEVKAEHLTDMCLALRDQPAFDFKLLLDVCGIDYLEYGKDSWETTTTTETGFSRGVTPKMIVEEPGMPNRFAVIYHLLSLSNNHRIRLKVNLSNEQETVVDSVIHIWPAADWFEREAFDLFGIIFRGHPDLRRILTDYGFVGHPFRKDYPLIGKSEVRYDAKLKRVIYEPVTIEPRILEPKVIRHDNRYTQSALDAMHSPKSGGPSQPLSSRGGPPLSNLSAVNTPPPVKPEGGRNE